MEIETRNTWKPTVAGILEIIPGGFCLLLSAYYLLLLPDDDGAWAIFYFVPIGILFLTAGIASLRRRFWRNVMKRVSVLVYLLKMRLG